MPIPSNGVRRNLLSNERLDTFWDALWLELCPVFYFTVEFRRIACRCLQTKRGTICYRMSVSTPSGTPCGSSYGRFCILWQEWEGRPMCTGPWGQERRDLQSGTGPWGQERRDLQSGTGPLGGPETKGPPIGDQGDRSFLPIIDKGPNQGCPSGLVPGRKS